MILFWIAAGVAIVFGILVLIIRSRWNRLNIKYIAYCKEKNQPIDDRLSIREMME